MAIRPGIYKHYKGNLYQVIEQATHSETGEQLVVYRPLYGERALWVRPLAMFTEQVQVSGRTMPRFAPQAPAAGQAAGTHAASATANTAASTTGNATDAVPASSAPGKRGRVVGAADATPASAEDSSLDAKIRAAMAQADERPDFSAMPIFEERRLMWRAIVIVLAVIAALAWVF